MRVVVNFAWTIGWTIFCALTVLVLLPVAYLTGFGPWMARTWARGLWLVCGVRVEASGLKHIDPAQPCVLMTNHRSYADVVSLFSRFPQYLHFVAKKELVYIPIFGQGMVAAGTIVLDRGRSARARASLERAGRRIREGRSVVIFPEGTRSKDGRALGPFKKGGFHLALAAGAPIVPGVVLGSERIMSRTQYAFRPGTVRLVFGPPIPTADAASADELLARARAALETLLAVHDAPARPEPRP